VLVVAGIIGYNFYNLSSQKVFASNYNSYELNTARDNDSVQVSPAEKAYREKNYRKTTELISNQSQISVKDNFLSGMAYLELGNGAKAIDNLKKVIAENELAKTNLFNDEAEYYLALAYIRNGDYDYALDLLRNIKEDPGHLYNKKMTGKLIRQVKMLKWR
jgi:tetratricopeptide (TPR) repeat protein